MQYQCIPWKNNIYEARIQLNKQKIKKANKNFLPSGQSTLRCRSEKVFYYILLVEFKIK